MVKETTTNKALSLKSLTKSTVWDVQENDIFRMLEIGEKDAELKDNLRHFADIIRSAFMIEEISDDKLIREKYTKLGYKVGYVKLSEDNKVVWAVKKRPITRVTDLTYENIRHITAAKLIEVLDRNFGGGWESLSQSIQDIIESGFDISTTTLPKDRLHKKGGMYEKKVADGYEVLEIEKGTWVEAIFAKLKPETIKPRMKFDESKEDEEDNDEDVELPDDSYNKPDEDDVEIEEPNDDEITEDNYRTTFDIDADPDEDAESLSDFIADE
ncbi:hypothetical protein SAMN04487851_102176 [Prevotella sp. tc2-28]|jgi:hypothetical protein|uniref:hypothetical protein n=1 Tax=Prevotella sp. tc2-28 TaxID=1761888 RepID=UPI00089D41A7|nr:hypothetical protein [Prevotella sp. tc2-28]SEA06362.1 hypothetical protein SAMN04487851_102176 [Prevotella sp. tc2-28]